MGAGKQGLYLPAMDVIVEVPRERLTKHYHRRWHATTGKYHALLRFRDTVDASGVLHDTEPEMRRLFGTPLFHAPSPDTSPAGSRPGGAGMRIGASSMRRASGHFVSFLWTRLNTDVVGRRRRRAASQTVV